MANWFQIASEAQRARGAARRAGNHLAAAGQALSRVQGVAGLSPRGSPTASSLRQQPAQTAASP